MNRLNRFFSIIITIVLVLGATNVSGIFDSEVKGDGAISNIRITQMTPDGYRISCTITSDVKSISFPTWTTKNGQDDLPSTWPSGTISGNTAYFDVKISAHNNEHGIYNTHIYPKNSSGNVISPYAKQNDIYVPVAFEPMATTVCDGHIYAIFNDFIAQADAESKCQSMGGHLATINSKEENDAIKNMISDNGIDGCPYYFLGAGRTSSTTTDWKWFNEETFNYTNWCPGQPDSNGEEIALVMATDGQWHDKMKTVAGSRCGFILEIEGDISSLSHVTNNSKDYYLIDKAVPHQIAETYCESKYGALATVKNDEDSELLGSMMTQGSMTKYFFGLKKENGNWMYSDGTPLGDFTKWGTNQPDNYNCAQSYGAIYKSDKKWDDEYAY